MPAITPPPDDRSSRSTRAEAMVRAAGRLLEFDGVADAEAARLANVLFRLASRIRTDRLGRAA
jgi:hypothetical protein